MPFVIDASALVWATTDPGQAARSLRERLLGATVHAPHLIDAEVGSALRKEILRRTIDRDHAMTVLSRYPPLVDERYAHHGILAGIAWELRETVSFYDGLYVALAAVLRIPLVTLDRRLASTPNLPASIQVADR